MEASEMNYLAEFLIIALSLTLVYSILIMLGGNKIFKKANQKEVTAYYPILNLFTMLEITDTSIYLGILFFVPALNVIALSIMLYRLGKVFNTSIAYKIGLVLLPIVCYPLLAFGTYQYKVAKKNSDMMNMKVDDINMMTQAELDKLNASLKEEENPKVDSIFKGNIKVDDDVQPYRAVKADVLGIQKLRNVDTSKGIDLKTYPENKSVQSQNQEHKKDDDVEFIDL
ncbi:MAG: hypothetical protein IJK67_02105 [Bacilli bacterium]|nr:hypothetical protein [Bacilli bacterium]